MLKPPTAALLLALLIRFTCCKTFCSSFLYSKEIAGAEKVYKNLEAMLGVRPSRLWLYMWKYVTPTVIVVSVALFIC